MRKNLAVFFLIVFSMLIMMSCQKEKIPSTEKKKTVVAEEKEKTIPSKEREEEQIPATSEMLEELSPDTVMIEPEHPRKGDTIVVRSGINAAKYVLYVNGKKVKESRRPVFKLDDVEKGDEIFIEVIGTKKAIKSDTLAVENTPPRIIYAELLPSSPTVKDRLSVKAQAMDKDNDRVRILYRWYINGVSAGEGEDMTTLDSGYKRGDRVSVKIIPYDEESEGLFIVREVEIGNALPEVSSYIKGVDKKTGMLLIEVKASDPDGDALTYSLQDAPAGMNIDSKTGLIKWKVPEDTSGAVPVQVEVDDGNGGTTLYSFEITITRK